MKHLLKVMLLLWAASACGQEYPFVKKYVAGNVLLRDSTLRSGQIRWFPAQNAQLKFRMDSKAEAVQYSPQDVLGFTVDSLTFVPLFNLQVYSTAYVTLGKMSAVSHVFGQVIDRGTYNIYLILSSDYNAMSERNETYANFIFEQKISDAFQYAAYPFDLMMKDSKYEKAKEGLYSFFKDYPEVIQKIKDYNPQDDFFEVIRFLKEFN
jgi:hypothetical protein